MLNSMRVGQALSCSQLYLQTLEQSLGSICESGHGTGASAAMKQGADASARTPALESRLLRCPLHFLLGVWPTDSD